MTSPLCNGNCLQGRRCDCVPEQDDESDTLTRVVDLILAVIVVVVIVAAALLFEGAAK